MKGTFPGMAADSRWVAGVSGLVAAGLGMLFMGYDLALEGWQELAHWHEWVEMVVLGPGVGLCVFLLVERARLRAGRAEQERDLADRLHLLHLGRLAAGIAHEVRNPLHNLRLIADRLTATDLSVAERDRLLARLGANLDRVQGAVEVVYQQARELEHDRSEPVALRAVLEQVLADQPGPVQMDVAQELHVLAPFEALRVILRNLLHNARAADEGTLSIRAETAGARVRLSIRNRGWLEQRSDKEGLGIGLHLSRLLAQRWNAVVTVAQDGPQVVASLDLPAVAAEAR